jgi:hypothetical protein
MMRSRGLWCLIRGSLSEGTVKVHLHHVFEKLAIRNRTALVAYQLKATTTDFARSFASAIVGADVGPERKA